MWVRILIVCEALTACSNAGSSELGSSRLDGGGEGSVAPAAGCTRDIECKGDRICSNGVCADPVSGTGGGASSSGGSTGAGGSTGTGGSGSSDPILPACIGGCCPVDASCYGAVGKDQPGSECLAIRKNEGQAHIQLRQTWIRDLTPPGITDPLVYSVLAGRTQLDWTTCNSRGPIGSGGHIQLIDFFVGGSDISKHYAYVGYSTYASAADTVAATTTGLCFGRTDAYAGNPAYALPTASLAPASRLAAWPRGLPKPMGLPWKAGPTKAARIAQDFDLATNRQELLARLDATGDLGSKGFGGVFFFDPATGYAHGFGALGWISLYGADGSTHLLIPLREVETKSHFNDPSKPNCVGTYRGDQLDPAANCQTNDPRSPAWGGGSCGDHVCDPSSEAPATTDGYFLISELQQLFSADLQKTLCASYPAASTDDLNAAGFYDPTTKGCKTAKWDPTKENDEGIPQGDWCSQTNGPATDTCHDAWKNKSLHTFSASPIKLDASGSPAMCAF